MQLRIDKFIPATVTHVNKRTENHGNSLKHAIDLNWRLNCPNTSLDIILGDVGKTLRTGAYERADSKDIPGEDSATPKLRAIFALLKPPHSIPKFEGSGYMFTIKTGEVTGESIELADVELSKGDYDPKDGGSTTVTFKSAHSGLTKRMLGELAALDGREVSLLSAPPAIQQGTMPDKKGGKTAKDDKTLPLPLNTPKQPAAKKPTKEAGEQFAEDVANGKTKPATAPAKKASRKISLKAKMALNARKRDLK